MTTRLSNARTVRLLPRGSRTLRAVLWKTRPASRTPRSKRFNVLVNDPAPVRVAGHVPTPSAPRSCGKATATLLCVRRAAVRAVVLASCFCNLRCGASASAGPRAGLTRLRALPARATLTVVFRRASVSKGERADATSGGRHAGCPFRVWSS